MRQSVVAMLMTAMAATAWGCESSPQVAGVERHVQSHEMVTPDEVQWRPGPASLPEGSEMAVLEGDPTDEGLFAMRLKLPDGYVIPPHWHPAVERVTILEGTFHLGMSRSADRETARELPAGSFFYMPPEMVHFAWVEGETIVQLNGIGPWDIIYVNPEDDPRR